MVRNSAGTNIQNHKPLEQKALLKSEESEKNETDKSFYQNISSQSGFKTTNHYDMYNDMSGDGFNSMLGKKADNLIKGGTDLKQNYNTDSESEEKDDTSKEINILNNDASITTNNNLRSTLMSKKNGENLSSKSQTGMKAKLNPYLSSMFKERDLFSASNAYHRLDKSNHILHNKSYAQTILNDLKRQKRANDFADKLEYGFGNDAEQAKI